MPQKRIKLILSDDQPDAKKFLGAGYLTTATIPEGNMPSLTDTSVDGQYGVGFHILQPHEIYAMSSDEMAYSIFMVDLDWSKVTQEIEMTAKMNRDQRETFGIVLAEHILNERNNLDPQSVHVLFYSNKAESVASNTVQDWKEKGTRYVELYVPGHGDPANPPGLRKWIWNAYLVILGHILDETNLSAVTGKVEKAVNAALAQQTLASVRLEDFVGDGHNDEASGFRLGDLAWPFVGYLNSLSPDLSSRSIEIKRLLGIWLKLFNSRKTAVPLITRVNFERVEKCKNEPQLVVATMLRYGLSDALGSSSKHIGNRIGVSYADFYLYADLLSDIQAPLVNPLALVDGWVANKLLEEKNPPSGSNWSFDAKLNRIMSVMLGAGLDNAISEQKKTAHGLPAVFLQTGFFDIKRDRAAKRWDAPILSFAPCDNGKAWQLKIKAGHKIDCAHIAAAEIAHEYRASTNKAASLKKVWQAWKADLDHLELLEILAENVEKIKTQVSADELRSLGLRFAAWMNSLKKSVLCIETCAIKLAEMPRTITDTASPQYKRLEKLLKEFSDGIAPRLNGWKALANLLQSAFDQTIANERKKQP